MPFGSAAWGGIGGSGGSGDTSPPAILYTPASSAIIEKTAAVTIEVTDDSAVDFVVITVELSSGLWEVAFDGTRFATAYLTGSSYVAITGGYEFEVARSGGWPSDLTFHTLAVDSNGNESTADAYYTLTVAAVLTVEPPEDDGLPKEIALNPDHVAQGLLRIIEQYKAKPRIAALITSYLESIQDLENAFWQLIVDRQIDLYTDDQLVVRGAVGSQLAILGKIVGQANPGLSDADFRTLIRARVLVNRSSGKAFQLIEILKLIAGASATIFYTENYPATVTIRLTSDIGALDPDLAFGLLHQAKAGGVRIGFVFTASGTNAFRFGSSTTGNVSSTTRGFGNTEVPGNGGKFSSARG